MQELFCQIEVDRSWSTRDIVTQRFGVTDDKQKLTGDVLIEMNVVVVQLPILIHLQVIYYYS